MLALQLAVPRAMPLPEPGVVRPFTIRTDRPAQIAADPVILARPLFAAGAAADAGSPSIPQGPVDGATAIGVLSQRGARIAFVQGVDGRVVSLRAGSLYRGWRLRAIGPDALIFHRGDRSASLPVTAQGARRIVPPPGGMSPADIPVGTAPANIPSGSPLLQSHG